MGAFGTCGTFDICGRSGTWELLYSTCVIWIQGKRKDCIMYEKKERIWLTNIILNNWYVKMETKAKYRGDLFSDIATLFTEREGGGEIRNKLGERNNWK